ncbi:MAG TPA: PKD domain-containing protein [Flavipsychrobacter sp.]|nr:PKD domain-containing protein [Flavipsychrobacter sp.]
MPKWFVGWFFFLLLGFAIPAGASHIVGGEVTYKCLEDNNYQITISIYEDCLTGLPDAIAQDVPAYISIFDGNNNPVPLPISFMSNGKTVYYDSIGLYSRISVPTNFSNACIDNPPNTCLKKATFVRTYYLPPNATGYTIVYQRCCRNASIINIFDPSAVGATYYCTIPPSEVASCNNSAVFKNYPPQIICINNPLYYDHSATDADGDSLSYDFCQDYTGGSDTNAKPIPGPPPFQKVNYVPPFSFTNPMAGYPQIQIDPKTGIISGTPNLLGRYVVTVCCHEWRNGVMINTIFREFQFVVTDCSKAVVADIPQLSAEYNTYEVDCKGFTVTFLNHSKGGFSYYWNFGDTTNIADSSSLFEPTYTYPDTGVYPVRLIVNKNSTCTDSITRLVKLYPYFNANYKDTGLQCPNTPINFTDISTSTYKPADIWQWSFGDGTTSTIENPTHIYKQGGTYNIIFNSQSEKGCTDTVFRQMVVEDFQPFAGNDTIIVKGQSIYFNAVGGTQFTWSPATNLNDSSIGDPIGYYPDTGHFDYNVHITSAFGCMTNDSIRVFVVGQGAYFVPTAFTPNGDGKNDIFSPIAIGYKKLNSFNVYNRWGQEVYHTDQIGQGWDGTYNGVKEEMGVYFWTLDITDRYGNDQKAKGNVTLIR